MTVQSAVMRISIPLVHVMLYRCMLLRPCVHSVWLGRELVKVCNRSAFYCWKDGLSRDPSRRLF
jgi:hypothetical protein